MENITNRKYKDTLFRRLFGSEDCKENALCLYNALNGSHYTDPDDLTLVTLEDVIYMGMKNDVSFLIYGNLVLVEHQSTVNPNMPLRQLFYSVQQYRGMVDQDDRLYGTKLVKIPTPRCIVFYNGTEDVPECMELKLSDAFIIPDHSGKYEWTAEQYNINKGKNKELLEKCRPL